MADLAGIQGFIELYAARLDSSQEVAEAIRGQVQQLLIDSNIAFHVVAARAKTVDSVRAKLLSKDYGNPRREMTDQIGARIIVYRSDEVDVVAEIVRKNLKVIKKDSVDKRLALGLREFGYRSYHLICRVPSSFRSVSAAAVSLAPPLFEVQIRSILEHSWAEIEHGVAYKSGAELPTEVKRRFASVAGVLELLEQEFKRLGAETLGLVDAAVLDLSSGRFLARRLDVPLLLALLEIERAGGLSFRSAASRSAPFPPGIERRLVLAMGRCGLGTPKALLNLMSSSAFKTTVEKYSAAEGVASAEVSHLAVSILLIGLRKPVLVKTFFPEFWNDSSIQFALT